jgi:hypothetical protein
VHLSGASLKLDILVLQTRSIQRLSRQESAQSNDCLVPDSALYPAMRKLGASSYAIDDGHLVISGSMFIHLFHDEERHSCIIESNPTYELPHDVQRIIINKLRMLHMLSHHNRKR